MLRLLDRLQIVLRALLVVMVVGLATAITLGLLLRPPPPVGYASVEGRPLLSRSGTGPTVGGSTPVRFEGHAIGVAVRCNGSGALRIELSTFGATETPCTQHDTSDGGFVLSNIPVSETTWRVSTRAGNRWSLVLTQPADDGGSLSP